MSVTELISNVMIRSMTFPLTLENYIHAMANIFIYTSILYNLECYNCRSFKIFYVIITVFSSKLTK